MALLGLLEAAGSTDSVLQLIDHIQLTAAGILLTPGQQREVADLQTRKAQLLISVGRGDEAGPVLDAVLETQPHDFGALVTRGALLESRSEFAGALSLYEAAAAVRPDDEEVTGRIRKLHNALSKVPEFILVLDP